MANIALSILSILPCIMIIMIIITYIYNALNDALSAYRYIIICRHYSLKLYTYKVNSPVIIHTHTLSLTERERERERGGGRERERERERNTVCDERSGCLRKLERKFCEKKKVFSLE